MCECNVGRANNRKTDTGVYARTVCASVEVKRGALRALCDYGSQP